MRQHLKRVGAIYLLAALAIVTTWLFWQFNTWEAMDQARQHGQAFSPGEAQTAFWSKALENLQSEWWQLLLQSIVTGAAVHVLFKKMVDDTDEIKAMVRELHIDLDHFWESQKPR